LEIVLILMQDRCVKNDFQAYGMFGANHAPILHQD
jgi:hypothetical protein